MLINQLNIQLLSLGYEEGWYLSDGEQKVLLQVGNQDLETYDTLGKEELTIGTDEGLWLARNGGI